MGLRFFEPAEAADVLHCTETFLTENAAEGKFPHVIWDRGKVVFTPNNLREIAAMRSVRVTTCPTSTEQGPNPTHLPAASTSTLPILTKTSGKRGVRVIAPATRRNRGTE